MGASNFLDLGGNDDRLGCVRLLNPTPAWTFAEQSAGSLGRSIALAGDVNGDGNIDILVGESQFDGGQTDEGRLLVFYGLGAPPRSNSVPDWTLESDDSGVNLGTSVSTAGDVNGDGFSDIVGGMPDYIASSSIFNVGGVMPNGCPAFVCGNGVLEVVETCDFANLGCETFQSQGQGTGILKCSGTCDGFDTSHCSGP